MCAVDLNRTESVSRLNDARTKFKFPFSLRRSTNKDSTGKSAGLCKAIALSMGNYDSHCCEGNKEEDEKKDAVPTMHHQPSPYPVTPNGNDKQQFSDHASTNHDKQLIETDISKTASNSVLNQSPDKLAGIRFDPRSPSCDITRTPVGPVKKVAIECLIDPRSPSVGINRTPILACSETENSETSIDQTPVKIPQPENGIDKTVDEKMNIRDLADPRSPTTELSRTPLKLSSDEESLTSPQIMEKAKSLEDPRSPSTEVSRTPLKIGATESLRRTVLLSNTFTPTLKNTPARKSESEGPGDNSMGDPAILNLSSGLLNLSCASNLNDSLSSSMMATCGSDSLNLNVESDIDDVPTDATFSGDEILKDEGDAESPLPAKEESYLLEEIVETLIANVEEAIVAQTEPEMVDAASAEEQKSPVKSYKDEKCLTLYRDGDEHKGDSDSAAEQSDSSVLNKSGLKPPRKVLSIHKGKSKQDNIQEGKQNIRYPLAVLGHGNSPDLVKPQQLSLKKSTSRVPRYRGKNSAMRKSSSLGCTPPRAEVAKYGKEN